MDKLTENSIKCFAETCEGLTCNEIYNLFEDLISYELRDFIYTSYPSTSPEPCRAAMIAMGEKYNIQSLINF